MSKNLLIVESPAKAKTIEKYLGGTFKVIASFGHVRDLPKSKLGIDVEHNFAPQYMIPRGQTKRINTIKKALESAKQVYLATDLDREGEAIAWHITQLAPDTSDTWQRVTFSEITKEAVQNAVAHPRKLNMALVDAQQARRILDRLVGYSLSPILWKKIRYGLSAGRVQSVALKFLVDREREIEAFRPVKYWTIDVQVASDSTTFTAALSRIDGKKSEINSEAEATKLVDEIKSHPIKLEAVTAKKSKRQPPTPFTTSTLQQAASSRLGYGTRRTMSLAQSLYEAGHISYMRTDSMTISEQALGEIKSEIQTLFGNKYTLQTPRRMKTKSANAQEAHEAIRPTNIHASADSIEGLAPDQARLYELIRSRTLSTQMPPQELEQHAIEISAGERGRLGLRATGSVVTFDGFSKIYYQKSKSEPQPLPKLSSNADLVRGDVNAEGHETKPPARYSEAGLVKQMEASGVGRPSTYAPTISTLMTRGYVRNEEKQLIPQPIGMLVCDLLKENFDFVVDPKFTAQLENQLDEIAAGKQKWQPVIKDYYNPLAKMVKEKEETIEKVIIPVVETDEKCEKCGKPMVIKSGRFGEFMACSGWPECKNAKPIIKDTGIECPKCHKDTLIEKKTKKGRRFWGCKTYPDCDYATWKDPKKEDKKEDE